MPAFTDAGALLQSVNSPVRNCPSNQLDVDYLTRHGVYYANTAVSAAVRTADSTAALILQVMRAGSEHEMNVREGKFLDRSLRAKDVRRSTLGIIGMGE